VSLRADRLGVRVGAATLIDAVTLAARPGEVLALIGPSGAGKTTLLRVWSGELRPTAGAVTLAGVPLAAIEPRALARARAVLPQQTALRFPLTALEVVLLGRLPHPSRGESAADLEIAGAALALAEADHLAARLAPTLSGGEQQRVQLARAFAQIWEPTPAQPLRVLLLDEPTASLDPGHAARILGRVRRFARATRTAVVVAIHDLNAGARCADRVALLDRGHVVAHGRPAEVLTPERLSRCFGAPFDLFTAADGGFAVHPRPCAAETDEPWNTP
jgi:iron complex transport system ATP-binding protein